jgi:hypothetical protein
MYADSESLISGRDQDACQKLVKDSSWVMKEALEKLSKLNKCRGQLDVKQKKKIN